MRRDIKIAIKDIGKNSFWFLEPLPLRYRHVTIKLIKVIVEDNVAIKSEANAQSTGAPVNLLFENGVVKVHPAIVFVKSIFILVVGKNPDNESSDTGKISQA